MTNRLPKSAANIARNWEWGQHQILTESRIFLMLNPRKGHVLDSEKQKSLKRCHRYQGKVCACLQYVQVKPSGLAKGLLGAYALYLCTPSPPRPTDAPSVGFRIIKPAVEVNKCSYFFWFLEQTSQCISYLTPSKRSKIIKKN